MRLNARKSLLAKLGLFAAGNYFPSKQTNSKLFLRSITEMAQIVMQGVRIMQVGKRIKTRLTGRRHDC